MDARQRLACTRQLKFALPLTFLFSLLAAVWRAAYGAEKSRDLLAAWPILVHDNGEQGLLSLKRIPK